MKKFDGINVSFWEEQIQDVLTQKQSKSCGVFEKPEPMSNDDWEERVALAHSTISLNFIESVYFSTINERAILRRTSAIATKALFKLWLTAHTIQMSTQHLCM